VLSLGPLKQLALGAQVISLEPQPQPPSTGPVSSQAEEAPSVAAETRVPTMPPPPAPTTSVTEATATQAPRETL
jgi:hypothetical protein